MMTVNEVSKRTGVSIRTLQYYDKIGLLRAAGRTEAGYRLYDDAALERLQQILLFRELEFPLKDIQKIVENPAFDRQKALEQQITLLTLKKQHLEDLIGLAQKIRSTGGMVMDFTAFDTQKIKKYTEQYDNFLITRRVMLWAFITAVPLMLLTDGMPDLTPLFTQTNVLLSWLFLGVFGNAVCFAIWNIAFQRLGVVITNNYLYASPFVTLVVGYLLLDEQITVMSVIGAVLITVGVIVALKKPKETA